MDEAQIAYLDDLKTRLASKKAHRQMRYPACLMNVTI